MSDDMSNDQTGSLNGDAVLLRKGSMRSFKNDNPMMPAGSVSATTSFTLTWATRVHHAHRGCGHIR